LKVQHYIGGIENLGPIDYEKRVFVEEWEKRIFGIHTAIIGLSTTMRREYDDVPTTYASSWTWADLRKGAEAMNPIAYFQYRYYEKWLGGVVAHLVAEGYLTREELDAATRRYRADPAAPLPHRDVPAVDDLVMRYLREGSSPRRGPATPAFAVGDTVIVGNPPPADHTRLPGFLRGHSGTVERIFEGNYDYLCDTGVDGLDEPVPVYIVRFDPTDLWGASTEPDDGPLYAELYETYLAAPTLHDEEQK
jgi:nitrile hydratase